MKRYSAKRKWHDFNQTLPKIKIRAPTKPTIIRKYLNVIKYVPSAANHNPGSSG
jgi:hypothetical protein